MKFIAKKIGLYCLLGVPGLVVFSPLLFGQGMFASGDAVLQFYPSLDFFRHTLLAGDSVFWNPHSLTGFPTIVSALGGYLSPINKLAFSHFSTFAAYNWLSFFNFLLTGIFTFEFIRSLKFKTRSALFAGLVLPWTTLYFAWAGNLTVTAGFWILPGLFLFFLLLSESKSLWIMATLSIISGCLLGVTFLAGHFQWPVQALMAAGLWALFLDWKNRKENKSVLFNFQTIAFAILAFGIAVMVSWPQLHLTFLAKAFSGRAHGVSFVEAQSGAVVPPDILSFIFPNLSLPNFAGTSGIFYVGAVPWLLFFLSLFGNKDKTYKFFSGLAVLCLAASIKFSPLLWLANKLPVLNSFRVLSRFMYIGIFAFIVLAANGLERLTVEDLLTKARSLISWILRTSLAGFGLFVIWSAVAAKAARIVNVRAIDKFDASFSSHGYTLPQEHYHQVISGLIQKFVEETTFPHIPITVAMISLVLAVSLFYFGRNWHSRRLIFYILALAPMNLLFINIGLLDVASAKGLEQRPPPAQYWQIRQQKDFRFFTFLSGFTLFDRLDSVYGYEPVENVELQKNLLRANLSMFYDLDNLDYYDNLMDRRSGRLLSYLGSDKAVGNYENLSELPVNFAEKKRLFLERLPLLSEYNTKYIISAYELTHPDLKEVLKWTATRHNIPLYLYENSQAQPRYYLTAKTMRSPILSEDDSWNANMTAARSSQVLIECETCQAGQMGKSQVTVESLSNIAYKFVVKTETSQYFIFGQNFLPGWIASLDNKPTEIYRANYLNQAVFVPAGEHKITFQYHL